MKRIYRYMFMALALVLGSSCNNEWEEEQFEHYISLKAPVNDKGYTQINVRYREGGIGRYQLPVIVSGSTMSENDIAVRIKEDPDTLKAFNIARFSINNQGLFYEQLEESKYEFPETTVIKAGECVGLLNINFKMKDLDMAQKWILPLTVVEDNGYQPNMRKNYRKALLRLIPFNDYSGKYSTTTMQTFLCDEQGETSGSPIVVNNRNAYVVDDESVFFYAGAMSEDLPYDQRKLYVVKIRFNADNTLSLDAPYKKEINFRVEDDAALTYSTFVIKDDTRPYIERRYVQIQLTYYFSDITSAEAEQKKIHYKVTGTMLLERKINTQIPDEDQQVEW